MLQRYGLLGVQQSLKICFLTCVFEHSAFFLLFQAKNVVFHGGEGIFSEVFPCFPSQNGAHIPNRIVPKVE